MCTKSNNNTYSAYMRGWMVKGMNRRKLRSVGEDLSHSKQVHIYSTFYISLPHFNFQRKSKKLPFQHTEVQSPCTPPAQKIDSTPSLVWLAGQMTSSLAAGQHFLLPLVLMSVVDAVALGDLHQTGHREAGISSSL